MLGKMKLLILMTYSTKDLWTNCTTGHFLTGLPIPRILIKIQNMIEGLADLTSKLKNFEIYNFNSLIISHILSILASQNRFQSLHDEKFNILRLLE